ncbi:2Fe-2S iron-sulfur cluster binding domain-containing protein [Nocardioides cavernae]|uniref:2Fe-2S iron-sulfur cluster binding domain-containing protein n=1 Tax=Nocardioides cavernae TaxID=1921566 RepID=A0ABR8N7Y5_9ACTN|nr:2Fe-2S iron-sulfur cluster-binding protein [Nocardioides cavernae]MBD3924264.1 2Fe-2S iron-sulfur cluster binding domain-containing protein [Nocardioides cavernae]MBM7510797.1 carbon-monoxide dehydrogenase small subunit [Nocardioides cavernae]
MMSPNDLSATEVSVSVDGHAAASRVPSTRLLLDYLREDRGATAPKWGCGTGDCGACTVVLDGVALDSCLVYAAECDGSSVMTSAGLETTPVGIAATEELLAAGAVQCGICTPGFLVTIVSGVGDLGPSPTREQIVELLSGNVCRCTGYLPIIEAVQRLAARVNGG